jgi:Family of unknown function (DUF6152)
MHAPAIRLSVLAALWLALATTSSAHHSLGGQFDEKKSMTLTGVVSTVEWINPHPFIHVDVKNGSGAVATWQLSLVPIPMLRKAGLTKESLKGKPGGRVTITALLPRDPQKRIGWLTSITYEDGRVFKLSGR